MNIDKNSRKSYSGISQKSHQLLVVFRNLEKVFVRKTLAIMDQESVVMEINSNLEKQL